MNDDTKAENRSAKAVPDATTVAFVLESIDAELARLQQKHGEPEFADGDGHNIALEKVRHFIAKALSEARARNAEPVQGPGDRYAVGVSDAVLDIADWLKSGVALALFGSESWAFRRSLARSIENGTWHETVDDNVLQRVKRNAQRRETAVPATVSDACDLANRLRVYRNALGQILHQTSSIERAKHIASETLRTADETPEKSAAQKEKKT